jgi:phenylacetic acid degradation operon negative regulatory protein
VLQDRNTPALTARSVVASLVLGTRRGRLPGSALVRAATLFGFAEGTTRVALSRMVAAGELSTSDGEYALDGPLLDRHGRQEEGRRPQLRRWDGSWRAAVVGSSGERRPAAERAAVRRRLADLRLAEWREGVWIRPDNFRRDAYPPIDGCTWLERARFASDDDVHELVDKLWAPTRWAVTATELLAAMTKTTAADDIAETFRIAAAVVRHMRDDPLLPDALLPADWPGQELRAAYDDYEAAFSATLGSILG